MTPDPARSALEIADWRRRVFALYAAVRVEEDAEDAHELWRIERDDLIARHPATPMLPPERVLFEGLPIAPYDPDWRFELPIIADRAAAGSSSPPARTASCRSSGSAWSRSRMPEPSMSGALKSYGGGLFVPVRDALAGRPGGTYGGGRYLIDTIKGADLGLDAVRGTIVLDFNFAYNPSCAYDPAWACPLAQPGNVLPVPVPVGELYAGA